MGSAFAAGAVPLAVVSPSTNPSALKAERRSEPCFVDAYPQCAFALHPAPGHSRFIYVQDKFPVPWLDLLSDWRRAGLRLTEPGLFVFA